MPAPPHRPSPRRSRWLQCGVLCASLGIGASAQTEDPPPDGIQAGRWILAPYLVLGYTYDDNVFKRSEAFDPESDQIGRAIAGFLSVLPFRNSQLSFSYEANRFNYQQTEGLGRELSQDFGVDLELNFATGDRLTISDEFSLGFADAQRIDPGGELVFEPQPYRFNEWTVELDRSVPRRRGYTASLTRRDLNYETDEPTGFFDYRGFEGLLEYREPISTRLWISGSYAGRRFDHFDQLREPEVGEPFRQEISDALLIGTRGQIGKNQPFFVRLGYGRLKYELVDSSEFRGLVGSAQWRISPGSRTSIILGWWRRPLPSFFDTYYLVNELRVRFDRKWLKFSSAGIDLRLSRNQYGDPVFCGASLCNREDEFRRGEAYFVLAPHRRLGFRFSIFHQRRDSNAGFADFNNTMVSLGVITGWFD